MNKYRNSNASSTTKTYDRSEIEKPTDNIYEAISIIAKRSSQINSEIKKELHDKLDEFATHNDNLEEIFENKEQIEVSRYYERLPKSTSIAIQELTEGKIYHRMAEKKEEVDVNNEELDQNDLKEKGSSNESK